MPKGCVKIRVLAGGLCFPDVLMIEGKHMFSRTPPFICCQEVAGVIIGLNSDDVSNGNSRWKIGDKVFGTALTGSLASEAICDINALYKCPNNVDPVLLAGFETNYGTTYHALVDIAEVKHGETMLVLGASGGVGMSAIDLGVALGMKVVACASTDEKLSYCKQAGAQVLINYNQATNGGKNLKVLLKEAGLYGNIDVVYDPVGGDLSEQALRSLGFGGRFIVIGFAAGGDTPKKAIPRIPLNLALLNERKILGCLWGGWRRLNPSANNKNMHDMMKLVSDNKLKPVVSKRYSFDNYLQAFEDMMSRKVIGKIVVIPGTDLKSKL